MAKCKLLMQTAQTQKLIDFFDGYEDDKVKCKFIKKTGSKAEIECETELTPDEAAGHCKSLFKKTPDGAVLYFSIQPDGFFG
jgi:hypothetical protein